MLVFVGMLVMVSVSVLVLVEVPLPLALLLMVGIFVLVISLSISVWVFLLEFQNSYLKLNKIRPPMLKAFISIDSKVFSDILI